jgi:hypothetical protein
MNLPKEVLFFPNGNTAAFDAKGQQIPELQRSWLLLYVAFLESKGIDPLDVLFTLPHGFGAAKLFRTENGWNWEIKS